MSDGEPGRSSTMSRRRGRSQTSRTSDTGSVSTQRRSSRRKNSSGVPLDSVFGGDGLPAVNELGNAADGLPDTVGQTLGSAQDTVNGAVGQVGNTVGGVAKTAGGVGKAAGGLGKSVGGVGKGLGNALGGLGGGEGEDNKRNPLSLRLDVNLDVKVEIRAQVHGDVTLQLFG